MTDLALATFDHAFYLEHLPRIGRSELVRDGIVHCLHPGCGAELTGAGCRGGHSHDDIAAAMYEALDRLAPGPESDHKRLAALPDRRCRLVPFADLKPKLDSAFVVDELVLENSVVILFGESGTLKTQLALDISLSVDTGRPWEGRRVKGGPVIYAAAEGGEWLANRILATAEHRYPGLPLSGHLYPGRIDLQDRESVGDLIEEVESICKDFPPRLFVFDTLRKSMSGDEDKSKDVVEVYQACRRLTDHFPGSSVLLIHHPGKNTDRGLRGSYSLTADLDGEIKVERVRGDRSTPIENQRFEMTVLKLKDGRAGGTFQYRGQVIELGVRDDGKAVTAPVIEPADDVATTKASLKLTAPEADVLRFFEACIKNGDCESPPSTLKDLPGFDLERTSVVVSKEKVRSLLQVQEYDRTTGRTCESGGQIDYKKVARTILSKGLSGLRKKGILQNGEGVIWSLTP